MDYSIGSVADLISGSITPNKQKVVKKQFKMQRKSLGNINQVEVSKEKSPPNKKANKVKNKKRRNSAPPKIKQIKENEDISEDEQSDASELQDIFTNNHRISDIMEGIDDLLNINESNDSDNDITEQNAVKKSSNKNKKLKRKSLNNSGQEEISPLKAKLTKKEKKAKVKKINNIELTENTNGHNSDNEASTAGNDLLNINENNGSDNDITEKNAVKKSSNKNKKLKRKSLNNSGQVEISPLKAKLTKKEKKAKAKKINNIELTENTNGHNSDNETSTAENEIEVETEEIVKPSKKIKKDKKRKISNDSEDVNVVPAKKKLKEEEATLDDLIFDDSNSEDSDGEDSDDEDEKNSLKKFEAPNPNRVVIFVGNLPLTTTKLKLKKIFSKFGNVENARIRGIPVADPKIPKKVAAIKKQFHKDRTSVHGYVTFSEREPAERALSYNGKEYKGHHLRVNIASATTPDVNKDNAIFLGNVSFEAEEEELWKLFESCGEIESVRLIRDRRTNVGKGFGYVNFKSSDSVELALQMGDVKLKDRELRISLYNTKAPKKQNNPQQQKGENSEKNAKRKKFFLQKNGNKAGNNTKEQFQGKIATTEKKKKFNKGNQQKKNLAKKIAPRTMSG